MVRVILKRLAFGIPLMFLVSVVTFGLMALAPGDAAKTIAGPNATPAKLAAIRAQLGLDQPLVVQYGHWLSGALHGNLGTSLLNGQSVAALIGQRLEVTLSLVVLTIIPAALLGVALGAFSAYRRGLTGKAIDVGSMLGFAVPNYWLGLLLVMVFAVQLKWFPAVGFVSPAVSLGGWLHSMVLPVVTLALAGVAGIAKQTRDAMLTTLDREFITAHRADGVRDPELIFRHALRNSAAPVLSMVGIFFISMLGGTVLIEQVYGMPGLGGLALSAATQHDIPVIQGITVFFTAIVVAVNLVLDIVYGWLNPKVRVS